MNYSEKEREILKLNKSRSVNDNNLGSIAESLYNLSDEELENVPNLMTEVDQRASQVIDRSLELISKIFENSDEQTKIILQSNAARLKVLNSELQSGRLSAEQRLANVKESAEIRAESYAFKKSQDRQRLATIATIGSVVVGIVAAAATAVTNKNDSDQPIDTKFTN